jgi:hypothetical protein
MYQSGLPELSPLTSSRSDFPGRKSLAGALRTMYPNKSPALSVIAALNVSSEPSLPVIFQFFAVSSFAFLKVNQRWPSIRKTKLWLGEAGTFNPCQPDELGKVAMHIRHGLGFPGD